MGGFVQHMSGVMHVMRLVHNFVCFYLEGSWPVHDRKIGNYLRREKNGVSYGREQ